MIREIESADWPAFCERLTRLRAGATVKLETIESNGARTVQAGSAAFESMLFDQTGPCNNVITLRLRTGREIIHEILDPIQIRLSPSEGAGDFNPLEIKAESGITTLSFHPAIHSQILEGLRMA